MKRKDKVNETLDLPVAERKYLKETNTKLKEKIFFVIPFLILLFYIFGLRFRRNSKTNPIKNFNFNNSNHHDYSILGHIPYNEVSKEKLVLIEPNIEVHMDMRESLLQMKKDAKNEGIFLVF